MWQLLAQGLQELLPLSPCASRVTTLWWWTKQRFLATSVVVMV
jgi:hypothetical protein